MRTKRVLSIVLTLAMLLGMLPGMSLTASAAGNTTEITPTNTSGTMTITLTIKAAQTITASDVTATYGDTDKSVTASVTTPATGGGAISYTVKDGSGDYIDVASDGKLTIKKVPASGKAYVIVKAAETDDYAETTKEVTVTISKAEATVAAKDQGIMVGGTVPDLSAPVLNTHYSVTGLVGTDALTTAPTLAYQKNGSAATPDSATAGTYDIVPSGASAGDNYTVSYTNGTLTITAKDTQTITASDVTATYGETDKSVSATTDGNGEISYAVKAGSENYIDVNASTGALTIKAVPADGKAYVTVTASETTTGGTGDKGYAAATKDVTVNISKATVTIAAKDQSIYVGGTVPTLSGADFYTVTGLVGEETLTTNPTLAYQKNGSAATPDSATAGTYDIVPSGAAASDNYSISYTNGTLTISNKGTQTISAENVTATYGDTDKSVSATVTDPATGGGDISYAVKEGSADYIDVNASTGTLTIKKVPADGKAYVVVTAAETAAYAQATKEVTVTINKASAVAATVTANNSTYDGTDKPLVTVTGEATGGTMQYALGTDTEATEPYTTSIPQKTNVGTYYVWYKVVGDGNHNDNTPDKVPVTIAPKSISGATVTLDKTQLTYNGSQQTVNVTGVVVDGLTLTAGDYTVTGNTTGTDKNTYTVTVTGQGNFKDSATAQWKIVEKAMTVTAQNVNVTYDGQPHGITVNVTDPASGATVKYGKTEGTYDLDASPTITNASDSPLKVYFRVTAPNYTDYEGSATVTIAQATADPTAPTANTLTYNGEDQALVTAPANVPTGYTVQYSLDGTTYSDKIPTGKAAGDYTVKVKLVGDASHADVNGADVKVTIAKKALTVTANAQSKKAGEKDPELTYKTEGLVGNDKLTGALSRVAGEDVGTYDITVGDLKATDNYTLKFVGAKLTITSADEGNVEIEIETAKDVPKTEVKGVTTEMAQSLATDDEKQRIENGEDMKLTLEINNIEDTVSKADKEMVAKEMGEGDAVAMYLDISLYKQVGSDKPQKVTELGDNAVTVTITIPEDQRREGRTFYVVQVHDGEIIKHGPFSGNTITLKLDKFSTFALTYQDEPEVQESIEITGGDRHIYIGKTLDLNKLVVIKPEGLKTTLTWKSSKPKTVSVSKKGVVKGLKKGKAKITVTTRGGASASVTVEVLSVAPKSVKLTGGTRTIKVDEELDLGKAVKLTPKNAKTTYKWKSSKPKIAEVDENGVVTGLKKGTTTITVTTSNNKTSKLTVKVIKVPVKKIKFKVKEIKLTAGQNLNLAEYVVLTPKNASTTFKWKSSKTKVAPIDKNGVMKGKKEGKTTVTVTTDNGKKAKVDVIVENKSVTLEVHYDESYAELAEDALIEEAAEIAGE